MLLRPWSMSRTFTLIITIIIISFMQGIYTYIPETNYVPREYSVAAVLLLLFMVLISLVSVLNLLYFYISTFRSMCAVSNMAVFCSSLASCIPGMLLTYFLSNFRIFPVAPIITGIIIIIIIIISSSSSRKVPTFRRSLLLQFSLCICLEDGGCKAYKALAPDYRSKRRHVPGFIIVTAQGPQIYVDNWK